MLANKEFVTIFPQKIYKPNGEMLGNEIKRFEDKGNTYVALDFKCSKSASADGGLQTTTSTISFSVKRPFQEICIGDKTSWKGKNYFITSLEMENPTQFRITCTG